MNVKHILFTTFFLLSLSVTSQSRKQLEAQRKELQEQVNQIRELLSQTRSAEKNELEELSELNLQIKAQEKLVKALNAEATSLNKEITVNQKEIKKLNNDLKILKEDYADMIYKSYKSKSQQSRTMFLLSSQNFYQAYKRLEYMKQYTSFRKNQGEQITVQTNFVKKINDSLLFQKTVKDTLILSEKQQRQQIEDDRKNQEQLISIIKKKESKYKKSLQNKIKEEKKVTLKIDKKIRDEIALANRIAAEKLKLKNKPKTVKKNEFILRPEAKALAVKFELNKGKLPWPVSEGIVVRKFGKQPHPTFPGITINGTGLHIVTKKGISAEAIFNGKVLNIFVSSEGRKNVLIQHGNYISSYNNLEKVYVKKGDVIKTGQKIGQIFTDKVSKKTKLIFVIFKNTTRLNPSSWILRR